MSEEGSPLFTKAPWARPQDSARSSPRAGGQPPWLPCAGTAAAVPLAAVAGALLTLLLIASAGGPGLRRAGALSQRAPGAGPAAPAAAAASRRRGTSSGSLGKQPLATHAAATACPPAADGAWGLDTHRLAQVRRGGCSVHARPADPATCLRAHPRWRDRWRRRPASVHPLPLGPALPLPQALGRRATADAAAALAAGGAAAAQPPGRQQPSGCDGDDALAAATAAAAEAVAAAAAGGGGGGLTDAWVQRLTVPWGPQLTQAEADRGLTYWGSGERMRALARKLLAGRPIKVFALGASVTRGIGTSDRRYSYAARLFEFVATAFPNE